jgi:ABC-2 type transport system ATP-binding protein
MQGIPGVTVVREQGSKKWLTFDSDSSGIGEAIATIASQYKIKDLSVKEPSVESIIRNIYDNRIRLGA